MSDEFHPTPEICSMVGTIIPRIFLPSGKDVWISRKAQAEAVLHAKITKLHPWFHKCSTPERVNSKISSRERSP